MKIMEKRIPKREELDKNYCWAIEDIFESDEAWEKAPDHINGILDKYGLKCIQSHLPYYELTISAEELDDHMEKAMKNLTDLMNKTDKVHIVGPGTDISFSIKGIGSFAMCGNKNIPDGEVYSAPVKDSVNGYITYNTPNGTNVYEIFSVYTIKSESYYITTYFKNDDSYLQFLNTLKARSIHDFNVPLDDTSSILTLSTCDSSGKSRVIVHAKKVL